MKKGRARTKGYVKGKGGVAGKGSRRDYKSRPKRKCEAGTRKKENGTRDRNWKTYANDSKRKRVGREEGKMEEWFT